MHRKILPADVKNALIEVCGRSFWYKQPLFDMFARAGIPDDLYLKYEHEAKFKIARQLLSDLERMGDDGYVLQRRLLTELCRAEETSRQRSARSRCRARCLEAAQSSCL
jgi:hypothetical protein